jgi:hypothetical protein
MGKVDFLKSEIDYTRDKIRYTFMILFALVTALVSLFIAVLVGEKPVYLSVFSIILFILLGYSVSRILELDGHVRKLLAELKDT